MELEFPMNELPVGEFEKFPIPAGFVVGLLRGWFLESRSIPDPLT
jgi:hypothetical protein